MNMYEKEDSKTFFNNASENQHALKKFNGSYLYNELYKLKDSSHEAVEGYESLNPFKEYLHVERNIQKDLEKILDEIKETDTSQLILLCGSVGDGKSHLLAYLNSNTNLLEDVEIHPDATESYNKGEEAIDTLASSLSKFDDDNINSSNEKKIVCINLGILNNFIDEYEDKNFEELSYLIKKSGILNPNSSSKNYNQQHLHIISFADYNIFELYEDGVDSNYLNELFNRIIDNDDENRFYQAYLEDKNQGYYSPIIYNYELFMNKNVREQIIQLIIQAIIEFKTFFSTRDLLNFVYEIIVPPKFKKMNKKNLFEKSDVLLPNLLFNTSDSSPIVNFISKYDPIDVRNSVIDDFIINIYLTNNLKSVISKYFINCTETSSLIELIGINEIPKDKNNKKNIFNTLLRYSKLLGKEIVEVSPTKKVNFKRAFVNKSYEKYIGYLYAYKFYNEEKLDELDEELRNAVFNWKGSLENKFITIEEIKDININKEIDFELDFADSKISEDESFDKFENSIVIDYDVGRESSELNIDYNLYNLIYKLNKGYKPNKNDKENFIIFENFIEDIIKKNSSEKLLIDFLKQGKKFNFEFKPKRGKFVFEQNRWI